MSKILLEHAAIKSSKKYKAGVEKMVSMAIAAHSSTTQAIEMISVRELHEREKHNLQNMNTVRVRNGKEVIK